MSTLQRTSRFASIGGRFLLATSVSLIGVCGGCGDPKASPSPANERTTAALAPAVAASCGKTGQPDCPLQSWMKATVQTYLKANDTERLAAALEILADHEPSGYVGWADSARRAAESARAGDVPAAKAECKRCHDEHRSRFRAERRATRLF